MEFVKAARKFSNYAMNNEDVCYDIADCYIEGVKYVMNETSQNIDEETINKAANSFTTRVLNGQKYYSFEDMFICGAKWAVKRNKNVLVKNGIK